MLCQACGSETSTEGLYCLKCGVRVNKECPRCAEIIKLKAKVCRYCGCEFTGEEIAALEQLELENVKRKQAEFELAKQEQQRADEERERRLELEREKRRQQEEIARWNAPDIVRRYGTPLKHCPKCSTLNSLADDRCRRCSGSLAKAEWVKNPYS